MAHGLLPMTKDFVSYLIKELQMGSLLSKDFLELFYSGKLTLEF